MKRTFFTIGSMLVVFAINAQSISGTVEYQNVQKPAAVLELSFTPEVVRDAMDAYMIKKGKSKVNDLKGFSTFRNTQPRENEIENADLYFKVERKSRKDKEISVLSLLITMPGDGISAAGNLSHLNMQQSIDYLNDFLPSVVSYDLELQIKEQNNNVQKEESKQKDLEDELKDLEKKRVSINKKIEEQHEDIKKHANEVERQKILLEKLVNKRNEALNIQQYKL